MRKVRHYMPQISTAIALIRQSLIFTVPALSWLSCLTLLGHVSRVFLTGDADTNDEGSASFAEERGESRPVRPRGATPGQGFNTFLEAPARRKVEGTYAPVVPSLAIALQGNQQSAALLERDTGQHVHTSSYGHVHDEPYSNPSGQGPHDHDAASDVCYGQRARERQGSLQSGIGGGLYYPPNPLPQYLGDTYMHGARGTDVADQGATIGNVNHLREPTLQTTREHRDQGRQPTPTRQPTPFAVTTSQPAPPNLSFRAEGRPIPHTRGMTSISMRMRETISDVGAQVMHSTIASGHPQYPLLIVCQHKYPPPHLRGYNAILMA